MTKSKLKSPFPYFGGKGRVAKVIWSGLGEVANYVEPFAGSLAVLLANPQIPKIETVNDKDCFISNFWRAVSQDPEGVAKFADYPVHEADLHARHKWLVSVATDDFRQQMNTDPDYYDLKIAGWWVHGQSSSIGNNWLNTKGLNSIPLLSSAGGGINGLTYNIQEDFIRLQKRLRRVRVCCGDWKRILSPGIILNNKSLNEKDITGIFLDPPYLQGGRDKVYKEEENIFKEVCEWSVENGNNLKLRIVICGYDGDFIFPDNWKIFSWQTNGGMANAGNSRGKVNSAREKIWFSPHCLNYD